MRGARPLCGDLLGWEGDGAGGAGLPPSQAGHLGGTPASTHPQGHFCRLQGPALSCLGDAPKAAVALGTSWVRIQRENALGKSRVPLPRMVVVAFGAPCRAPQHCHRRGHSTGMDLEGSQLPLQRGHRVGHPAPRRGRAPRQQRAPGVPETASARGRREGALWERVLECHGWYLKRSLRALNKIFQFQGAVRSRGGHQK